LPVCPAAGGQAVDVKRQPDHVCVLPRDPSWIQEAGYLEDGFGLLGRAAEVADARGEADRYVLSDLTYRIAAEAIGRIKDDARDPKDGRPTVCLYVVQAFELDALWKVLGILRRARDGEDSTAEVRELIDGTGECFSPSRTAAAYIADLEKVLAVLTLDIPASWDIATAFAVERAPGFDFDAAYEQLATVWKAAGVKP
jgi:hypothetical protein